MMFWSIVMMMMMYLEVYFFPLFKSYLGFIGLHESVVGNAELLVFEISLCPTSSLLEFWVSIYETLLPYVPYVYIFACSYFGSLSLSAMFQKHFFWHIFAFIESLSCV